MKVILFILMNLAAIGSAQADAVAVNGCGYTSDGVYRCSDFKLRTTPPRRYEEQIIEKSIQVNSASIVNYRPTFDQNGDLFGYFDVQIDYCLPNSSSVAATVKWLKIREGQLLKNPAYQNYPEYAYTWTLGGVPSTIKRIPMSLTYQSSIYETRSLNECYLRSLTVHLFCQLQARYDGAQCNFTINERQTLTIEMFRNHINQPSLMLY